MEQTLELASAPACIHPHTPRHPLLVKPITPTNLSYPTNTCTCTTGRTTGCITSTKGSIEPTSVTNPTPEHRCDSGSIGCLNQLANEFRYPPNQQELDMRRLHALIGMAAGILCGLVDQQVSAAPPYFYSSKGLTHEAMRRPWHQSYYHSQWGRPVPLVVPPVAGMHTEYSWGVTMNEMRPIYHHYSRSISGHTDSGVTQPISPSPYSPTSTRQMGVNYIRAPW